MKNGHFFCVCVLNLLSSCMTIFLALLFSLSTFAYEVSFTGPCSEEPLVLDQVSSQALNVGALTVDFLNDRNIPFLGSERGINSVFNTPTGDAAIEVLSDTEMRAYGWCYFVDGMGPDVFADAFPLNPSMKKIEWIFGFAHYKDGQWISYCTLAHTIKPDSLSKK